MADEGDVRSGAIDAGGPLLLVEVGQAADESAPRDSTGIEIIDKTFPLGS
jgi:hypothetical protein